MKWKGRQEAAFNFFYIFYYIFLLAGRVNIHFLAFITFVDTLIKLKSHILMQLLEKKMFS